MIAQRVRALSGRVRLTMLGTIYPGFCAICGERGGWVCAECLQDYTPLLPDLCCDRCGHPAVGKRCECREMHPAIFRARAFALHHGWPAHTVRRIKYDRERHRVPFLVDHMLPALASIGEVDVLLPVPLHIKRKRWRGFDQARMLANRVSEMTGIPVEHGLQRVRYTTTQVSSSRKERQSNMEKAFALAPGWVPQPNTHYVLIDDVYTTGATVGACAEVLEAAGAKRISVLTAVFTGDTRRNDRYLRLLEARSPQ